MQFNSYLFIFLFLPITVSIYWPLLRYLGRSHATIWLIAMSVIFYACASLKGLAIVGPSILIDYGIVRCMLRPNCTARARGALLTIGVCLNVIFLGYFKYKNFFFDIANSEFGTHFSLVALFLPVGISFLVFQKIAFLTDVASGELEAVKFLDYLLFTTFFPRTIAGPIVHYREVVPQFSSVSPNGAKGSIVLGLCLFSIGLFKKTVLADFIGQFVPDVFDASPKLLATQPPGMLDSWIALLAYTFQLYFDFSGYSDMALGAARMVGIRLPFNFNSPFKATSIVEFWSRWHVTLTRFLTSYIYTPIVLHMTRARMSKGRPVLSGGQTRLPAAISLVAFPTMVTMTLSGLWHGAGWHFIAWGALHGTYLVINQCYRLWRRRLWRNEAQYEWIMTPICHVLTFSSVVFALVLFRASSIGTAETILASLLGLNGIPWYLIRMTEQAGASISWIMWLQILPWSAFEWIVALLLIVMCFPNSQEYVRRLEVTFGLAEADEDTCPNALARGASFPIRTNSAYLMATITAVMCALGVMAIAGGGGFIYGGF